MRSELNGVTKSEHLRQVLAGDPAVGPAMSCWYHFPPAFHAPERAVEAHLRHLETFDLDFVKVMNEVGDPREAFGPSAVARAVDDLSKLRELPGDAPPFDRQLEIIRLLAERLGGRVPMTTTIFNAWVVLRRLTQPPPETHGPPTIDLQDDPRDRKLTLWLREDFSAVAVALAAIGRTLANFARACIEAGADGIYLALRDDWVDTPANLAVIASRPDQPSDAPGLSIYDELVAETDRMILSGAAGGWFNMLHLCGRPLCFERHVDNPHVHAIHWADRITGPSIAVARQALQVPGTVAAGGPKALACGVNNLRTLPHGTPADVAAEVRDARAAARGHPLIIAPGCTYDPDAVPDENVHAMVAAARGREVS
ncbi:MAG TPA: hypothetical protein VM487_03680 [Phycisphaerae bacterium]|nr:hypothetical protein [Phycisphaerae bacterium]